MSDEIEKNPGEILSFGSVNVKTGDYFNGYIENGEMKYKYAGNDPR